MVVDVSIIRIDPDSRSEVIHRISGVALLHVHASTLDQSISSQLMRKVRKITRH